MVASRRSHVLLALGLALTLAGCASSARQAPSVEAGRVQRDAAGKPGTPTPDEIMVILSERGDAM